MVRVRFRFSRLRSCGSWLRDDVTDPVGYKIVAFWVFVFEMNGFGVIFIFCNRTLSIVVLEEDIFE